MKTPPAKNTRATGMWIGVGVVFALMATAWTAMFYFANKHRPAEVPLEHHEGR
ncbi:MAG: hypothetical protein WC205_01880 [Opitutaceae bacterium]|jgi:hypothetical protein